MKLSWLQEYFKIVAWYPGYKRWICTFRLSRILWTISRGRTFSLLIKSGGQEWKASSIAAFEAMFPESKFVVSYFCLPSPPNLLYLRSDPGAVSRKTREAVTHLHSLVEDHLVDQCQISNKNSDIPRISWPLRLADEELWLERHWVAMLRQSMLSVSLSTSSSPIHGLFDRAMHFSLCYSFLQVLGLVCSLELKKHQSLPRKPYLWEGAGLTCEAGFTDFVPRRSWLPKSLVWNDNSAHLRKTSSKVRTVDSRSCDVGSKQTHSLASIGLTRFFCQQSLPLTKEN